MTLVFIKSRNLDRDKYAQREDEMKTHREKIAM